MATKARLVVFGAILLLAGCGKVGSPETPPGSTYPKVYPASAVRLPAPTLQSSTGPVATFTASGAWIDPSVRRPIIDPNADIDQKGSGGAAGVGSSGATSTPKPSNTEAGGAPMVMPTP